MFAHDLYTTAPLPLERTCWKQFVAQREDGKKSGFGPFSIINIVIYDVLSVVLIHETCCTHCYKGLD